MKNIITVLFMFIVFSTCAQNDTRVDEIRQLYENYNATLSSMDSYEIKLNTGGESPFMTVYTDFKDEKLVVKMRNGSEMGSSFSEYYFLKNEIQFIYTQSAKLLTHWSAKPVIQEIKEFRFYFKDGKVIRTLKKMFKGAEAKNIKSKMSKVPNKSVNYKTDKDAKWNYHKNKIQYCLKLFDVLNDSFDKKKIIEENKED